MHQATYVALIRIASGTDFAISISYSLLNAWMG
jgi:hypothetical protein